MPPHSVTFSWIYNNLHVQVYLCVLIGLLTNCPSGCATEPFVALPVLTSSLCVFGLLYLTLTEPCFHPMWFTFCLKMCAANRSCEGQTKKKLSMWHFKICDALICWCEKRGGNIFLESLPETTAILGTRNENILSLSFLDKCVRRHMDLPVPCSRAARCTGPSPCEISRPACNLLHCCGSTVTWSATERPAGPCAALKLLALSEGGSAGCVTKRLQMKFEAWSRWRTPPSPQKRLSGVVSPGNKQQTRLTSPPLPARNQSFVAPK